MKITQWGLEVRQGVAARTWAARTLLFLLARLAALAGRSGGYYQIVFLAG
jgi:hypothetical protein